MKLIRNFIALLFLMIAVSATAATQSMPSWMVKISKSLPSGKAIKGTGYLVQFKGRLFVRTASHVTLGSAANIAIEDFKGRPVAMVPGHFVTNNMVDDQLIEIATMDLQPLAVYNPQLDLFVVTVKALTETYKSKRRVSLDHETVSRELPFQPSFIVSPSWVKREQFQFKSQQQNTWLMVVGKAGYDEKYDELRSSIGGDQLIANVSIIPGESGSPIIGWTSVTSIEQEDMNFRMRLEQALKVGLKNDLGQTINSASYFKLYSGSIAIVEGHAIAYHRQLPFSLFASAQSLQPLHKIFDDNLGRDIGNVSWVYDRVSTYRVFNDSGVKVGEVFGISDLSGDGTAADGGDGTAADGGDGTAADGGSGTTFRSGLPGMMYNGKMAVGFKLANVPQLKLGVYNRLQFYFEKEAHIAANWQNFVLLRKIQALNSEKIFEVSYAENLLNYFDSRFNFKIANVYQRDAYSCTIERAKLAQNILSVKIRLGAIKGDEEVVYEAPLEKIRNLVGFKTKSQGNIRLDLSRLWGLDLRFMGVQFNPADELDPFVFVKSKGYRPEKFDCVLF
jgi:hypothetical protein